jgi:hypothetical protein
MRTRFGFFGGILILALGAGITALAYQAGLNQGAATAASAGSVVVVGGGPGAFGILGVLFGLFFLFLLARIVIGITFFAFGRGRGSWGGDHPGRGAWFDRPAGGPGAAGFRGPAGDREAFVAEMHRRLHERDAAATATATAATAATGAGGAQPGRSGDATPPAPGGAGA